MDKISKKQSVSAINIIIAAIAVLVAGFLMFNNKTDIISDTPLEKTVKKTTGLVILDNDFDFGDMPIFGGNVKHEFTIQNKSENEITIKKISTSCMCTTAMVISDSGEQKGPFGMIGHKGISNDANITIKPGENVKILAIFDPLAHGPDAVGKIIREIYIETDYQKNPKLTVKFKGNVVKPDVSGPSLFIPQKEYDFGTVKQSAGTVSYNFEVLNNGTENISIESLPTSCACTSAKAAKKIIKPEEKTTITVFFDPNLHLEPEGRFFKTIEIVSNVKPNPELKIYAQVDYDFGLDKLKLQEEHRD